MLVVGFAMLLIIIRVLYAFVCAGAVASLVQSPNLPPIIADHPFGTFVVLMMLTQSVTVIDLLYPRKRLDLISAI
ncbi:MAG: PIN/TRAM domain-containing protein, partial [Planctomycetales bacterium 12-60-4]